MLNREKYVDVSDVKLVQLPCVGYAFFLNNGDEFTTIIPCQFQANVDHTDYSPLYASSMTDKNITEDKLYEIAQNELSNYERASAQIEQWKAEHPGETPFFFGYMFGSISEHYLCSEVNSISNVYEYLGINPDDYRHELDLSIFEYPSILDNEEESDAPTTTSESGESIVSDSELRQDQSEPNEDSTGKIGIWIAIACGALILGGIVLVVLRKNKVN